VNRTAKNPRALGWMVLWAGILLAAIPGLANAVEPAVQKALAPTGKLRVGLQLSSPTQVIKDPSTGEMKGVGYDLGRELARRLEVPFEPVILPSIGAVLDAGKQGKWDVAFFGYNPTRLKDWDYAPLHLQVEFGYLVLERSSLAKLEDIDQPGVRVAVQDKSLPAVFLSKNLKKGTIVPAANNPATLELLKSGGTDAVFSLKPNLFQLIGQSTGFRVLDGSPGLDPHAMAMPKGRDNGHAYAHAFIEEAKSSGLVKAAIERVGLQGVVVAPASQ
jgi:polar amino acid transport system substrate-binding protein